MLAILHIDEVPESKLLQKLTSLFKKRREINIIPNNLGKLNYLYINVKQEKCLDKNKISRSLTKKFSCLAEHGIVTALTEPDFNYSSELLNAGIKQVSALPLYMKIAGRLVFEIIRNNFLNPDDITGTIYARKVTRDVHKAACELISFVKYVRLDCGLGVSMLERELMSDYGVSAIKSVFPGALTKYEIIVLFSKPDNFYLEQSRAGIILNLCGSKVNKNGALIYTSAEVVLPSEIITSLPCKTDLAALSYLLLELKEISPGDIEIIRLLN